MTMPHTPDNVPVDGTIPRRDFYAIVGIALMLGLLSFLGVFFVRVGDNLKVATVTGIIVYLTSFVVLLAAGVVRAKRRQKG